MSAFDAFEVVRASLDALTDQEVDCIPHFAAVSLWRLHATGRGVSQRMTCEILRRCLTRLGVQVEVLPVLVRIRRRDEEHPIAEYGIRAPGIGGQGSDWYFVLVLPEVARVVDAHLPELPAIVGSDLEDRFLQAPFFTELRFNPFGVDRFDRVVEYYPVDAVYHGMWEAVRPQADVLESDVLFLLSEVLDVLRWQGAWQKLGTERWSRLRTMMQVVADAQLTLTKSGGPEFVYPNGRVVEIEGILRAADARLADG